MIGRKELKKKRKKGREKKSSIGEGHVRHRVEACGIGRRDGVRRLGWVEIGRGWAGKGCTIVILDSRRIRYGRHITNLNTNNVSKFR